MQNIAKEAINARVIDVGSRGYPITKSSNQTPVIGHQRDRAPITFTNWCAESQSRWRILL